MKVKDEQVKEITTIPLFHFLPSSKTYEVAIDGQNLEYPPQLNREPGQVEGKKGNASHISKRAIKEDCQSISFIQEEPSMALESLKELIKQARSSRLKTILRTNGYMQEKPLQDVAKIIHAFSFLLPSADKDIFFELTHGKLYHVEKSLKLAVESPAWVEITTPLIENVNDNEGELRKLAEFISTLGKNVPWHITGELAKEKEEVIRMIALEESLPHVYIEGDELLCHKCGKPLVDDEVHIKKGKCEFCNAKIEGIF